MNSAFLNIFGIIGFIILLWVGLRLSKRRIKKVKYTGIVIIIISLIGLLVNFYVVLTNYIL